MPKVAIVDYGMGNLFSVRQACNQVGLDANIVAKKEDLMKVDAVILPGVGAFGDAMETLNKLDMVNPILDFIQSARPFMGICLGMQLLMSESEEFGIHKGLDVMKGRVVRFSSKNYSGQVEKVPQVGWNQINRPYATNENAWDNTPLDDIRQGEFMYFVHSYYCNLDNSEAVLSVTTYGETKYCSSFLWKNIFACQFHPEKSASEGLKIYKNWSRLIKSKSTKGS